MKKTGLFKILTITTVALVLLTWFIPAGYYYSGEMVTEGLYRYGFFDLINFPFVVITIEQYLKIVLMILAVGGFYGVLSKTNVYRNTLEKIAKSLKGKELIFLIAVAFVLAALTSVLGLNLYLFIFIPALVGIILLMGYDKVTALLVTFVSTFIGMIGSTYSYAINGYINAITGATSYNEQILFKVILFLVAFTIYMVFTLMYAKKNKRKVKEEEINELAFVGEKKASKKSGVVLYIIFGVIFVLLVLGLTSWTNVFKVEAFTNLHNAITGWTINDEAVLSSLLGNVGAFGTWTYTEVIFMLAIFALIIGKAFKLKLPEIIDAFGSGAKKVVKPALITVLVIMVVIPSSIYLTTICDWFISHVNLGTIFNVLPEALMTAISSAVSVDMVYVVQSSLSYLVGVYPAAEAIESAALVTQSIYGLTMMVAPTSMMLVLGLQYLGVPYKEWMKKSWKMVLSLLAAIIVICIIAVLV